MKSNTISQSQLIFSFGPGSMVDLPDRSVIIGGLNLWNVEGSNNKVISEPRLSFRVGKFLKEHGLIEEDAILEFQSPPVLANNERYKRGIDTPVFPKWFVCEKARVDSTKTPSLQRRQLVHWDVLDSKNKKFFWSDDNKRNEVTPIRFVGACEKGHLQDINWKWVIHGDDPCEETIWLEDRGTSADPTDTRIVCNCGKQISLKEAFIKGRLGKCKGKRPWLLDEDPEGCDENLRLLTRTATYTYFPQIQSVISIPEKEDELSTKINEIWGELEAIESELDLEYAKKLNRKVSSTLGEFSNDQILASLLRNREIYKKNSTVSAKIDEFDVLTTGKSEIGSYTSELYAITLPRKEWEMENSSESYSKKYPEIKNLVAVHRLREVTCIYGFTRFEAAPTSAEGLMEDLTTNVKSAPISKELSWLPRY